MDREKIVAAVRAAFVEAIEKDKESDHDLEDLIWEEQFYGGGSGWHEEVNGTWGEP
jgi:hypothetical protein